MSDNVKQTKQTVNEVYRDAKNQRASESEVFSYKRGYEHGHSVVIPNIYDCAKRAINQWTFSYNQDIPGHPKVLGYHFVQGMKEAFKEGGCGDIITSYSVAKGNILVSMSWYEPSEKQPQ